MFAGQVQIGGGIGRDDTGPAQPCEKAPDATKPGELGVNFQWLAAARAAVVVKGQTAHTFEWSDWRSGEIWWIQSVYVHPLHRGMGVFRALFDHIRQLGEEDAECCGIRLYMEHGNEAARQSDLRLGFREPGDEVLELLFPAST